MGEPAEVASSRRPFLEHALDADSHEMVPVHLWPEVFGEEMAQYVQLFSGMALLRGAGPNAMVREDIAGDVRAITRENVWELKGPDAPSAIDLARRVPVLDQMGIERQLVYPTMATMGYLFLTDPDVGRHLGFDRSEVDLDRVGRVMIDLHNSWVGRVTAACSGRVRPVAVAMGDSVAGLTDQAEAVLAAGARALMIPAGLPPGGMSPADRRLDPFWRLVSEAGVPVVHHVTVERGFLRTTVWAAGVPEFAPSNTSSPEFHIEPWRCATLSFACESFLAAMILGGVFERHSKLCFGIAELTAGWVGPFGQRLDDVVAQFRSRYAAYSMLPSERLSVSVRVVPFPFEAVDRYIESHPWMADVLCFGSDFPHQEGGIDSKRIYDARLRRLGDDIVAKFFRDNAALLLPVIS
ncbi:MAG: amidohydrolase family protein [Actinomycetota bacterium]|nr:amidohydrolase family protein [Actinomycetota bacterium]